MRRGIKAIKTKPLKKRESKAIRKENVVKIRGRGS